ncbi:MAG: DUF2804 domain-containing protein [Clostridium sp.]|uniref:DUF2804 domain-containing protein n=1 Tax=Clostridium culturomicium TaxID=1499683 RepID=UPI00058C640D|nr:DUF2804 domain-containing protein [Clostridium culturomicium]MDU4891586.1 DUF2804 domain-containing protein [Clostridium sp.]MDU7085321.1 DUF2804 domain-containing protein [Clostridium sp.]
MQNKIMEKARLLNERGELTNRGYATSLILDYSRKDIKAAGYRIKEWDYYLITNDDYGVALTIADNSYMALLSVSFLDFKKPYFKTTSVMKFFTCGKLGLPATSQKGDVEYKDNRIQISFKNDGKERRLDCNMKKFDKDKDFFCSFILSNEPRDSMVIATPFKEDKKAFYYNQKINCMEAKGKAVYGDREILFDNSSSMGVLDWGRGVWTYKNTWYWGSASGKVDGIPFGFNIGYGFGDTSDATENMVFYDGVAHKLDEVIFNIPKSGGEFEYEKPWTFTSNDNRFTMNFIPIIDRKDSTSVGIIASDQHQVFGKFTGTVVLDDGRKIEIKDFLGFAERVMNKW